MKIKLFALSAALLAHAAVAQQASPSPAKQRLTLSTPAFEDGGLIPSRFTTSVPAPVSPRLEWSHVPDGTVSFTLIMHDPDTAPKRGIEDNLHWMAFNIPGAARELPEGVPTQPTLPDGTLQSKNVHGSVGYLGPGAMSVGPYHHYTWELFALDTKLDLPPGASRADVFRAMDGHILAKGVVFARFHL
jgi:Raf kinase inhibitor-like YbhB/YbcL family protein